MKNKGFTLIELLVVVAIIGILATVVLASLGAARNRAKDAAVLSNTQSLRSEIELEYGGVYTGLCTDSGGAYDKFLTAIEDKGGELNDCEATGTDYRVIVILPSALAQTTTPTAHAAGENGICVNSNGTAEKIVLEDNSFEDKQGNVVKEFSFDESIPAPACNSGEVEGGTYSQYCLKCSNQCYEQDTSTGDTIGYIGTYLNPLCSIDLPDCHVPPTSCR